MTKVTVITSGKGGVGKTSISVNTALELARKGYRVCLFDADLGLANVNILLDLQPRQTLADLLEQQATLQDILLPSGYGFDIIPASSGIEEMANLSPKQLQILVRALGQLQEYDHFLIDTSSGISKNVISFCLAAEQVITVVTPESTSITDAYALVKVLAKNAYGGQIKILVNKCEDIPQSKRCYLHFKGVVEKHLGLSLLPAGAILADPSIEKAVLAQQPLLQLFPQSMASQCLRAMVLNLLARSDEIAGNPGEQRDMSGFWSSFVKHLQKTRAKDDKPPQLELATAPAQSPCSEKDRATPKAAAAKQEQPDLNQPLPTPKQLQILLFKLYFSSELGADELEKILRLDPALTLRVRNLWGPRTKETTSLADWQEMIAAIGSKRLGRWLLGNFAKDILAKRQEPPDPDLSESLWQLCYATSVFARDLATATAFPSPEEAAMAGLLHEIGLISMLHDKKEIYAQLTAAEIFDSGVIAMEQGVFGYSRHDQTARLLKQESYSDFFIDSVRFQEYSRKQLDSAFPLTRIVYFARQLALLKGNPNPGLLAEISTGLGLAEKDVHRLYYKNIREVEETCEKLGFTKARADIVQQPSLFSQQLGLAKDYLAIHSLLDIDFNDRLEGLSSLYQATRSLFNSDAALFLTANKEKTHLVAEEKVDIPGSTHCKSISFSLASTQSRVVKSFTDNVFLINPSDSLRALADIQLARTLKTQLLVTLPLRHGEMVTGVVAVALSAETVADEEMQRLLRNFAAKAATLLSSYPNGVLQSYEREAS